MSRGLGRFQRKILDVAEEQGWNNLTRSRLCWLVAGQWKGIADAGDVKESFYRNFRRAITSLRNRGEVKLSPRKLESLAEVVELYPHRTCEGFLRDLRLRLLPYLEEIARGRGKFPEWNRERHSVLRHEQGKFENEWVALRQRLLTQIADPAAPGNGVSWGIDLLARGQQLFSDGDAEIETSFLELLTECRPYLEPALSQGLEAFYEQVLPRHRREHGDLKSTLYVLASFTKSQPVRLSTGTKQALLRTDPDYVRSMPGYEERPGYGYTLGPRRRAIDYHFSPDLDRLLDRHVFAAFHFLSR